MTTEEQKISKHHHIYLFVIYWLHWLGYYQSRQRQSHHVRKQHQSHYAGGVEEDGRVPEMIPATMYMRLSLWMKDKKYYV